MKSILVFLGVFLAIHTATLSSSRADELRDVLDSVGMELILKSESTRYSFIDLVHASYDELGGSTQVTRDAYLQDYLDAYDKKIAELERTLLESIERFLLIQEEGTSFEEHALKGRALLRVMTDAVYNPQQILKDLRAPQVDPEACSFCSKKTYLMFPCKCEGLFCMKHRNYLKHKCKFDHKAAELELLRIRNPQVVASKIRPL